MVIDIVGKFARVISEAYEEYGVGKDSIVFIAGSGFAPVDDDDNYKLLFVVNPFVDGKLTKDAGITVVRKYLELLADEVSESYMAQLEKNIAEANEEATSH